MNNKDVDIVIFCGLFREVCAKCFGHPVVEALTETESKVLYNKLLEETGLVVGWKSIKNYSLFVLSAVPVRKENPSVATLDTFARYVLGAPYTTEAERKEEAGPYGWWYRYKKEWLGAATADGADGLVAGKGAVDPVAEQGAVAEGRLARRRVVVGGLIFIGFALLILVLTFFFRRGGESSFVDTFHSVREDSLAARGWMVSAMDTLWWGKRGEGPGGLTLYTLKGDNWPDPSQRPVIHNLLWRAVPCDCFTAELHLEDFIPRENWQQAGILLSEDTGFAGKSLRVSIAYNDYGGGYTVPGSVLLQAITSPGRAAGKPEEIAHYPLINIDTLTKYPLLARNLGHPALRIERQGERFRILYSDGILENTSFKEVVSHTFAMKPRYVGLFALKGFVDGAGIIPARVRFFGLYCETCK